MIVIKTGIVAIKFKYYIQLIWVKCFLKRYNDVFFFFFFITPKREQKVPLPFAKSCLTNLALCPHINALFL